MSNSERPADYPIPEFSTREEEAAFWDTHDFADYWDQLQPVNVTVGDDLVKSIQIRLDSESLNRVHSLAHAGGVAPDAMLRGWILERLKQADPLPG